MSNINPAVTRAISEVLTEIRVGAVETSASRANRQFAVDVLADASAALKNHTLNAVYLFRNNQLRRSIDGLEVAQMRPIRTDDFPLAANVHGE